MIALVRVWRLGVLSLAITWTASWAQQPERAISFEAESVYLDLQRGNNVFKGLAVTDGSITVYAAEGTTTRDGANGGEWNFGGGVRVAFNAGTVIADSAVFRFSAGLLARGELLGDPVVFETPGGGDDFRGTAGRISYDGATRTLSAFEGAEFTSRGVTIENCNWTYDFDDESASGLGEGDGKCVARNAVSRESTNVERR